MTVPEHVAHHQQPNDSGSDKTGLTAVAAHAPNDELPAMLGRATHAQAAVNLSDDSIPQPRSETPSLRDEGQTPLGILPKGEQEEPGTGNGEDARAHRQEEELPQGRQRSRGGPRHAPRVSFDEFAFQIRLHKYHKNKVKLLRRRQDCLRTSIALSRRLHRVGSVIHDGLVELSGKGDKAGFVRVYQHMHDLVDVFYTHWKRDLDILDPVLENENILGSPLPDSDSFVSKLPPSSRSELFGFIHSLRSNPHFLADRIKALSPSHLATLTNSLGPREVTPSVGSLYQKLRSSQRKRFEAFSYGLEDHALSFDRSNPLSFLLFNVFGGSQDPSSPEYMLRLSTWSSICTTLFLDPGQRYHAFVNQILTAFAKLSVWRAKERLELFLMDTLQKGAFLLEPAQSSPIAAFQDNTSVRSLNLFGTQASEEFFDKAVLDLFDILNHQDGGFPEGVLHLVSATLGHMTSIDDQSAFRGHVFFQWFLPEFLRITIDYPENENMLLQCHISKEARTDILHHLYNHAQASASDVCIEFPSRPVNRELGISIEEMIGRLTAVEAPRDLYNCPQGVPSLPNELDINDTPTTPFIVLSATDIVRTIDALFPPPSSTIETWTTDPFISSSATAFSAQYSYTTTRLDKLRREIILLTDLATQPRLLHPCQENWILMLIGLDGKALDSSATSRKRLDSDLMQQPSCPLDRVRTAALQLVERRRTPFGTPSSIRGNILSYRYDGCLEERFRTAIRQAQTKADSIEALYWYQALECLSKDYPASTLAYDDTRVLGPMFQDSKSAHERYLDLSTTLENNILELRHTFDQLKDSTAEMSTRLDRIRTKMWYSVAVINSDTYEDAKNIASALNNMATPAMNEVALDNGSISSRGRRPPSSSSSSLLDQPREDTINILKASSEHGGPKKLADSQLEMTRKWLQRNSVDNFCKGEERIHRFCMEIKIAAKKLVGETMNDSPVLWSSELFAKERANFDPGPTSAQMSTRAPSIISEAPSSGFQLGRLSHRGLDTGLRGHLFDSHSSPGRKSSFHSLGSGRLPLQHDLFAPERSSSGSSPGRAVSATTTTDSISSVWSPHTSYSQSATSASVRSRPASTYNDVENAKTADQMSREKGKFLETLQHDLLCMLLSDLGCPVWSCGSETDAWLQKIFADEMIQRRLKQRMDVERLVSRPTLEVSESDSRERPGQSRRMKRSSSAAPRMGKILPKVASVASPSPLPTSSSNPDLPGPRLRQYSYTQGYEELFNKLTQEIDPLRKLQALNDFKNLALAEAHSRISTTSPKENSHPVRSGYSLPTSRRSSFDPRAMSGKSNGSRKPESVPSMSIELEDCVTEPEEAKTIQLLKDLLMKLRPKTLFRDLQYISAFVAPDTLNKTESGRAFLHFGLAALAYKDEMCRSMVDVADRIILKDLIKRKVEPSSIEPSLSNIAEFWIFAAREGYAVAQRELASLYLTCPERVPVVTLPLSLSSETFKNEMMWQGPEDGDTRASRQKLCLALHWMQQAAINGDEVALRKMKEREIVMGKVSVR